MKKIIALFVSLMLLAPVAYGQTKKPQSKKPQTTKTTNKPAQTKATTASAPVKKQEVRLFEGTLMYVSQEYHSEGVRKYSYGQAYNGQREQSVTISGNKAHVIDENICIHKIFDGDANMCYIYSDITSTGVSYPLSDYRAMYSQMSDNSKYNKLTWDAPGTTNYRGDELKTRHASITPKMDGQDLTGSLDIWSSSAFLVGSIMKDVFYGADPQGLIKKYMWETKSNVPFVGTMHSIVSAELIAIREYPVSPTEFTVPEGVTIIPDNINSCKETNKMYKAHQKALKNLGLIVNESAEAVLPQIRNEWPYVLQCEADERYTGSIGQAIWGQVGKAVITQAASIAKAEIEKRQSVIVQPEMTPEGAVQTPELLSDEDDSDIDKLDEESKRKRAERYAQRYEHYESHAKKVYKSLTSSRVYKGYSSKDKKGKDKKGHYSTTSDDDTSSAKGSIFISQNKQLRSYQEQMRVARRKAGRLGLKIEKSEYEDIKVTYK